MTVIVSDGALANIQDIAAYIGRQSAVYAEGMAARIFGRINELEAQPLLGPVVEGYGDESLRELLEHPYRIVYRIGDDAVEVVGVFHAARRLPRGL